MIFCYEQDTSVREVMLAILDDRQFDSKGFGTGKELFKAMTMETPYLVVADLSSGDEDKSALLQYLRKICSEKGTRILVVDSIINARQSGEILKEPCIYKPFNASEFITAVNNALVVDVGDKNENIVFGKLYLSPRERRVFADDAEIFLTNKEYDILRFLISHPDRIFTREQLFNIIWNSDYMGQSRTVDVHMGTLRSKLMDAGEYIKTIRGKGYCISEM